jgi:uncharacterized membrane protein
MKKSPLLILALILVIPSISAVIQADYQIIGEKILTEINIDQAEKLELNLPYDASVLEINTDYVLEDNILKIDFAQDLEISYITKTYIDKSKNKYYFVIKNQLGKHDVSVYLDEGSVLVEEGLLFPSNPEISTDGRRIILTWKNLDQEQIIIEYGIIEEDDWHYIVIIAILVLVIIIIRYFDKKKLEKEIKKTKKEKKTKKTKEKKEGELTKNLYEDEKKIVRYLLTKKNNEAWTKEIQKDLEISKVKLSRKLRSLEAKEVIKKIPYGNENRIRLLK